MYFTTCQIFDSDHAAWICINSQCCSLVDQTWRMFSTQEWRLNLLNAINLAHRRWENWNTCASHISILLMTWPEFYQCWPARIDVAWWEKRVNSYHHNYSIPNGYVGTSHARYLESTEDKPPHSLAWWTLQFKIRRYMNKSHALECIQMIICGVTCGERVIKWTEQNEQDLHVQPSIACVLLLWCCRNRSQRDDVSNHNWVPSSAHLAVVIHTSRPFY